MSQQLLRCRPTTNAAFITGCGVSIPPHTDAVDFNSSAATWLLARAIMRGDVRQVMPDMNQKAAKVLQGKIASYINPRREPESDCSRDRDTTRRGYARRSRACCRASLVDRCSA